MTEINKGTLTKAALRTGISEKTARKHRRRLMTANSNTEQVPDIKLQFTTKAYPFEKHWPKVIDMLLKFPELQTQTILTYLAEQYPNLYKISQVRSLQPRIKAWRAESGSSRQVIFRQDLKPGRQSQSDWTHMGDLGITINSQKFKHLLFYFMLPYSGFETVMICYSESFETLTRGFEQGVMQLGGVANEHRTDNLTASRRDKIIEETKSLSFLPDK